MEVRSVFSSVCKAANRLFPRRDPDRVVHPKPQPDQDDSDPRPIRNTPTADKNPVVPVCLPGQVCEDVYFPEPSRTERLLDTDPDPEPSPVADLGDEKPAKGKKKKGVPSVFRSICKAAKRIFHRRDINRVYPTPQPETDDSDTDSELSLQSDEDYSDPDGEVYLQTDEDDSDPDSEVYLQSDEDYSDPDSEVYLQTDEDDSDPDSEVYLQTDEDDSDPDSEVSLQMDQDDSDPDSVVYLQPNQDDSAPRPIRNTPTADKNPVIPVCLPGQVCEDVFFPEPSRTERILDTDPDPEADLGDETPKQENESSRPHAFFKRVLKAIKKPFSSRKSDLLDWKPNTKPLKELYDLGEWLDTREYCRLYKAIRKSDGRKVVIKKMFWDPWNDTNPLQIPGCPRPLPKEVGLMLMLRSFPVCPYIIQMYEWSDRGGNIWISQEYFQHCEVLSDFTRPSGLTETVARRLTHQLVLALQHCIKCGVFNNFFYNANILVKTDTLDIKLFDFGASLLLDNAGYESSQYEGCVLFRPPEVFTARRFHAVPTNVWCVGVTLYKMVYSQLPFYTEEEVKKARPPFRKAGVSDECLDLIRKCLERNPAKRPTLEQILQHEWFKLCVTEPSRTERILDTDPDPEPSPVADLGDETPKQGNESSRRHAFFKRVLKAIKKPFSSRKSDLLDWKPNTKPLNELYDLGDCFEGMASRAIRKSDGQQVLIKTIGSEGLMDYNLLQIPGCPRPLPKEVGLMLMARSFPACPYIIQMYEWSDCDDYWITLEFPQPCMTLEMFMYKSPERLTEAVARGITRQLVLGLQHCIKFGVFFHDLNDSNILVKTDTLDIKLINFGTSLLLNNAGYARLQYEGEPLFSPPEALLACRFRAVTTNVWGLGVVLYLMVNKELPFSTYKKIKKACLPAQKAGVSDACYDLISQCLKRNPVKRPTLEQILEHEWFKLDQ